ncbi:type III secretion system effector XopP [Xanthomonas fragariae]|uniref:type III secretion system effector XopP n=1 Tax=Xanthomonas fragariae TaxID=48664 RepID=UPI000A35C870|nr:type III secretion system effector XopP [Xanthomonas fragariae]SMQ93476.1 type III effector protein XopP [Xanthomonas fragariae]
MHRVGTTKQRSTKLAESVSLAAVPADPAAATSNSVDGSARQSSQLDGLSARPTKPVKPRTAGSSAALPGPSHTASSPASDKQPQSTDPADILQTALRRVEVWSAVLASDDKQCSQPGAAPLLSRERRVELSQNAMKSAREGLQAIADLRLGNRLRSNDAVEHEATLFTILGASAATAYEARSELIEHKWAHQFRVTQLTESRLDNVTVRVPLHHTDLECQDPDEWYRYLSELEKYRSAMDESLRNMKKPDAHEKIFTTDSFTMKQIRAEHAFCHGTMRSIRCLLVDIYRIRLWRQVEASGSHDVTVRLHELYQAKNYLGDTVVDAFTALSKVVTESIRPSEAGAALSPQLVAQHKDVLEDYAEQFGRVGLGLCLDVAALIKGDGDDNIWQSMLDLAQVLTEYRQSVLDLIRSVGPGKREVIAPPPATIEEPPVSRARQKSARRHRKPVNRTAAESSLVPAPPAVPNDTRTLAQQQADIVLKKFPLERAMVTELDADLIQIANRLGKDTGSVNEMMHCSRQDAMIAFTFVRSSIQGWFEKDQLLQAKAKLPPGDERIAQLSERLELLGMIEQRVKTREADALKSDTQPRAPHLSRLLEMHQVARVTSPTRLRSDNDSGDHGTLFEMRIEHAPLSNGERPAPWFVHLHTAKPVTTNAVPSLDYKEFTAVHLKTAKEKNLGKRWEMLMQALGNNDAKVHRSKIDSALLASLLEVRRGRKSSPEQFPNQ